MCIKLRDKQDSGMENLFLLLFHTVDEQWRIFSSTQMHIYKYPICRNKRPPRNKRSPKTVIFQRGEYIKPMNFNGWFFKGGSTWNQ